MSAQTVYLFDCLDGRLYNRYWSLEELKREAWGENDARQFTENDARRVARDLEATLYRCEVDNGEVLESTTIYDPWDCFG